jgi:O-antigen/teichoic acid export membrane protein
MEALLCALCLRREYQASRITLTLRGAWRENPVLWRFSLPALLSTLIFTATLWGARVLLVNQPGGYIELGLFNAALQFQWMITAVNTIAAAVAVPILAELHGRDDPARFDRAFALNLRLNWSLALVLGFVVLALSPWLMLVFGEKFQAAAPLLPLVVGLTVLGLVNSIGGQFFYSAGLMWEGFKITIISCFLLLTIAYWFIPALRAKGLALAYIVSSLLSLIYRISLIHRKYLKSIIYEIKVCFIISVILILGGILLNFLNHSPESLLIVLFLSVISIFFIIKDNYNNFILIYYQISAHFVTKVGWSPTKKQ